MGSTNLVQVLQRQDDFPDVNTHCLLGEVIPLVQMSEHLPATHIVCAHKGRGCVSSFEIHTKGKRDKNKPSVCSNWEKQFQLGLAVETDALLTLLLSFLTFCMLGRLEKGGNQRERSKVLAVGDCAHLS